MKLDKIRKMQAISHRVNRDKTELRQEFVAEVKKHLDKRGYRADLHVISSHTPLPGNSFPVEVKYNPQFEFPVDKDLMAVVAQAHPEYQIDWDTVQVDTGEGMIYLNLEPSVEVIPLKSLQQIPPEFTPIGTGIFRRKADATGDVFEVWELKRESDGFALIRKQDDLEVVADEDQEFTAGDVVNTPHGPGKIVKFDDVGNAFVQVGKRKHLLAQQDLTPYNINKEKQKLEQYYAEIYGPEFAQDLVKDYDDQP